MKHIIIYILFVVSATLLLVNRYTDLYINNYAAHFVVLFIAAASFVVIIGHFFGKLKSDKSIVITFLIVGIVCFTKGFLTWGGDWKTQTIIYQDKENSNKSIDFEMRGDRFAFGYKKRVVQVYRLAPFMLWVTDVDTARIDPAKWNKVNLKVNELMLSEDEFQN